MIRQNAECLAGDEQKYPISPSVLDPEILFQMLYGLQGTVLYQNGILKLFYKSNFRILIFAAVFSANKYT